MGKHFKTALPYLFLLIAHIIWGANFVVAKIALQEFPVMSLAFLRFALAALLIVPFLLTLREPADATPSKKKIGMIKIKHLPKLLTVCLLMTTVGITFFYEGLKRTTAIDASVLTMSIPMISVLAGWMFLKEKVYWVNLLGILLGLFGAVVIIGLPQITTGNFVANNLLGNGLILASCITGVAGFTMAKEMLKTYPPVIFTGLLFLVGTLSFLVPAILEYLRNPNWVANISVLGFLGLMYIVILGSLCAFLLMNWGLAKIEVYKANLFHYVEPAVAATFAAIILSERISFSFIIGTCLVILGVYWGTLGKTHHHHPYHKSHRF